MELILLKIHKKHTVLNKVINYPTPSRHYYHPAAAT